VLDQKNQERVQYNQSCNRRPIDQLRRAVGELGLPDSGEYLEKMTEVKKASRGGKKSSAG
jgi:hypothetical protein